MSTASNAGEGASDERPRAGGSDERVPGASSPMAHPAATPADPGRAQLDVLLTEYNSLRHESLSAITNRITVMNFTFGALSIVLAGLLATRLPTLLAGTTALLFVPQIAKAALLIWLGEYNRSQRAGRRLQDLEARINGVVGAEAIGWETQLAALGSGSGHMSYPYRATVLLVLGAGYAGTVIGVYLFAAAAHRLDPVWIVLIVLVASIYSVALEASFLLYFLTKWRAAYGGTTISPDMGRMERAARVAWSPVRRRLSRSGPSGEGDGPNRSSQ